MLVVVCGLPGVGKTTVAKKIAEDLGARLLATNDIRRELFPSPRWTPDEFQHVYDELFARAETILRQGHPLVLDGTFVKQKNRDRARDIARDTNTAFGIVLVTCDEATIKERIEQRAREDPDGAPYWAYELFKTSLEPVTDASLVIDNRGSPDTMNRTITQYFL